MYMQNKFMNAYKGDTSLCGNLETGTNRINNVAY